MNCNGATLSWNPLACLTIIKCVSTDSCPSVGEVDNHAPRAALQYRSSAASCLRFFSQGKEHLLHCLGVSTGFERRAVEAWDVGTKLFFGCAVDFFLLLDSVTLFLDGGTGTSQVVPVTTISQSNAAAKE